MADDTFPRPAGGPGSDHANAEAARQIERDNPDWIVVFGVYTKEFVAFPLFSAPPRTVAVARYPGALPGRMRDIERRLHVTELAGEKPRN